MVTHLEDRESKIFSAVADPVRREILDLLRGGKMKAGDIAENFTISRPAVAKHVRILKDAGLVSETKVSRLRIYQLQPDGLREIDRWLEPHRLFWAARMMDLKTMIEADPDLNNNGERDEPT